MPSARQAVGRAGRKARKGDGAVRIMLTLIATFIAANLLIFGVKSTLASGGGTHPQTYLNLTAKQWHQRAVTRTKERNRVRGEVRMLTSHIRRMRQAIVHRSSSLEAIRLASITYGVPYSEMLAVAMCETGGTLSPYAKNRSSTASGLLQFLTSTFAGTPYGRENIFSPYANALAAGWLWKRSGWSPWVCKP